METRQVVQDFWREKKTLHINVKELKAAIHTILSLGRPKDHINLCVDNSVTYHYLRKGGGRLDYLNQHMQELWRWMMKNKITLSTTLVRSQECQSDYLTRKVDHVDYTLDSEVFQELLQISEPWEQPRWDMFASPSNAKMPLFACRWPHWQASLVDSLHCPLEQVTHCFANPPWKVIGPWLHRLRQHPSIICLLVCPFWVSATWWPLLIRMQVPHSKAIKVKPREGLFTNCLGVKMPPTRWPLLCVTLSGKCYKPRKKRLNRLTCI